MDQFSSRRNIITVIVLVTSFALVARLFYIQVIDSSYKLSAENNSKRIEILYPARGLIYDRNRQLLVYNQPVYDLMIAPFELKAFDSLELCNILRIDMERLRAGIIRSYNPRYRREPFIKQLSPETYAVLQEKMYRFPGFYVRSRTLRSYSNQIASHLFGYVGEVDEKMIEADKFYAMGDYIGISGIEGYFEDVLRGEKGQEVLLVDVHGRVMGPYQGGRFNEDAVVGKDMVCTIDAKLQAYGETLMRNYKGSVVAIEPATGEILTLISAPSYSPSLLVGRSRTVNYTKLERDSLEPLFNRALMANYPPGSTFKPIQALIALQEGVIQENSTFSCNQGYYGRGVSVGCHIHNSPLSLLHGIEQSCNAYFCNVYKRIIENPNYESPGIAYKAWRDYVMSFGIGDRLNADFTNELKGFLAPVSYFDRYYGENHWNALTTISLAIGQGEILVTPLQMANWTAAIANRGYYIIPHVIKQIEGIDTIEHRFYEKHAINIDTANFGLVVKGMEMAVNGGPGRTAGIAQLKDIIVCGKTGTAENPQGQDHSVFIAFAPKDNPKIAISVYVEHGKWGASYAAPIASLMIEKYLTDTIAPGRKWVEARMLNGNLLNIK
ncbi:MAG TPA: penicillin-binding protein 2 [Bacteroidales bacterium]|nr:penicillin-binding protein 2 [Bacteroidales bacterium]